MKMYRQAHPFSVLTLLLRIITVFALAVPGLPAAISITTVTPAAAAPAVTNSLTLAVVSALANPNWPDYANPQGIVKGAPITQYKWIINQDNTGQSELDPGQKRFPNCSPYQEDPQHPGQSWLGHPNLTYPQDCKWNSIAGTQGWSPIIAQGDETTLSQAVGLTLPPDRYLISVIADGFKLDGVHFTVPLENPGLVTVELPPLPLPPATIRLQVFEDNAPVNGAADLPIESGLSGFKAVLNEWLGQVSTDIFGNPICTQYQKNPDGTVALDAGGAPIVSVIGGNCYSDANGIIEVPNMGPNRYAISVVPPDGSAWVQTTTLEGNLDFDTWVQEGATGNDTEFVNGAEPFPVSWFGYVMPDLTIANPTNLPTGEIKGVVDLSRFYIPATGGLQTNGTIWGGFAGAKLAGPIANPWIALSSLQNGDQAVYIGQGDAQGQFDITGVPTGDYTLTYWDEQLNTILDLVNVTVAGGQVVDMGVLQLNGWFTTVTGTIFSDINANGRRDPGEAGVPGFPVSVKRRENTTMDRGTTTTVTDSMGNYILEALYPLTQWLIVEAYDNRYFTTGVTYQADNQNNETTYPTAAVDFPTLPIIGLSGRLDIGVQPYGPGTNGGIVGTVSYDTTRNETDPAYSVVEPWQPSIPNLTVNLYAPIPDGSGGYLKNPDGSLQKGTLLNQYTTEIFHTPTDCVARDVNGDVFNDSAEPNPLGIVQYALPDLTNNPGAPCLEAPMMGVQFAPAFNEVNGNYGFGTVFNAGYPNGPETSIQPGDYLVEVEIPNNPLGGGAMFQVTREEDRNIWNGPTYVPNEAPPACVGPLHTVDVAGYATDNYASLGLPGGITVPASTPVDNPLFADAANASPTVNPYEGMAMPSCQVKLVHLTDQRSVAPSFNLFTPVPIPGRLWNLIVDDLNVSTNPQDLLFGEKAGFAAPVGVYDYANRLVYTAHSDPNGLVDVLLPSTDGISCPTPSGVCPNMYRMVGNDPGAPGRFNPDYNPQFRTISATFEVFPGVIIPADEAPTQVGVTIISPGSQTQGPAACVLPGTDPQFFAVNTPVFQSAGGGSLIIKGTGFGATKGTSQVTLNGSPLATTAWSDTQITATIPVNYAPGAYQLLIQKGLVQNGTLKKTVNGVTIHVRGTGYNPRLLTVNLNTPPSTTNFWTIQAALDLAGSSNQQTLVIVYPGLPVTFNPQGAYFENIVIHSPVKLQGVGPGGAYPLAPGQTQAVLELGSVIDGVGFGGDTTTADAWRTLVGNLLTNGWLGNQTVYEGQVVYVVAPTNRPFTQTFKASIDGFTIQGGDQMGFPGNINQIGGVPSPNPGGVVETQGGGIYVNGYAHYLQITNNILQSNGGSYGGAIRIGNPNVAAPLDPSGHNDHILVAHNRVIANGGTNLAGGIGLFNGSDSFEVANNDICGNFSAEYGGGLSNYGYSPNGSIHDNRIYFNRSFDEGGGIMIAGELPANPNAFSQGTGAQNIYNNLIQSNLGNDDGGGLRFLMAGNFPMHVYNNIIANNVSTHEGGGVGIHDTPDVRFYNNTVMKNITTATAATSSGIPAPAGLSTITNSIQLQATLPLSAPNYSQPLLFNNIFWDNRAGSWNRDAGGCVLGIGLGLPCDASAPYTWDMGVTAQGGLLRPTNSIMQSPSIQIVPSATNKTGAGFDPLAVRVFDTSVTVLPWRNNPHFADVNIVAVGTPLDLTLSDYHVQTGSPAINAGAANKALNSQTIAAPGFDIDNTHRPTNLIWDIGADEQYSPFIFFKSFIPLVTR